MGLRLAAGGGRGQSGLPNLALRYLHRLGPGSRGQDKPFAAILDFPAAAPMDEVLFLSGRTPCGR